MRQDRAVALHRHGESEKAEAEFAELIACRELTAGPGDEALRHAKRWHARVLLDLGRFNEAEPELRQLSEESDCLLGTDHPDALDIHENHAAALAKLNRVQEAEAEMAGIAAKRTAVKGAMTPPPCRPAPRKLSTWICWAATTKARPHGAN